MEKHPQTCKAGSPSVSAPEVQQVNRTVSVPLLGASDKAVAAAAVQTTAQAAAALREGEEQAAHAPQQAKQKRRSQGQRAGQKQRKQVCAGNLFLSVHPQLLQ